MRDAADMPELEENDRALGVDGIDDLLPAFDLRLALNAGNIGMTETARHDGGSFRYQKPAWGRALRVIFRIQRPRRERRLLRAEPRQRRQCDAMLELIGSDL
jgi:hypothetical protein